VLTPAITARLSALAILTALLACGAANAAESPVMNLGAKVAAPNGYLRFCSEQPEACSSAPSEAVRTTALAELARTAADREAPAAIRLDWAAVIAGARKPATLDTPAKIDWAAVLAESRARRELAQTEALRPVKAPGILTLAGDGAKLIRTVNAQVNRAILRSADLKTYGRSDVWALPLQSGALSGDCEDYVLEKRKALIDAGVAPQALSIAVVKTVQGQHHAVLLVATDKGELVLDNLTPWIVRWDQAGYEWKSRQVNGQAFEWAAIRPDAPLAPADLRIAQAAAGEARS
jgi:predicted transglutaminase-like cysteine proteinase